MRVKRYTAENIRKAMQLVKDELGEEAIILSNRIVGDMVEIIATEEPPIKRFDTTILQSKSAQFNEAQLVEKSSIDALTSRIEFFQNIIEKYASLFDFKMRYQTPYAFYLFNFLYQCGFSEVYSKYIVQQFCQSSIQKKEIFDKLLAILRSSLMFSTKEILGGYLFVGPSGSGKTSAIAKFSTCYRLSNPDAIISFIYLDLDKNGGERNLAQYAKILNAKFSYADSFDVFKQIIINAQNHDLVLIDSSFSFKPEEYEKIRAILTSWHFVTLGVVPTTHDNKIIQNFFSKIEVDELIITKVDESQRIGVGLSLAHELNKPIAFFSTGVQLTNQFPSANINIISKIIFDLEAGLMEGETESFVLDEPVIWKMSGAL